jgi:hypothetical protein
MSYDIYLTDPVSKVVLYLDSLHQLQGGTYAIGGTTQCWLNVTYNYADHFRSAFGDERGIRSLYGLTGAESIPVLRAAMGQLEDDVSEDYWEATEGNAKRALAQLLALAKLRPDGVWIGD